MTTITKPTKNDRIEFKVNKQDKQIIKRASKIRRSSITEYISLIVIEDAKKTIEKEERILATQKDQEIFLKELLNPSAPNEYLTQALKEHKQQYGE